MLPWVRPVRLPSAAFEPLLALLRAARLRLRARVAGAPTVLGPVRVRGSGRVTIGRGVRFLARQAPVDLHAGPGAEIVIGDGAVLESGVLVEALASVRIGAGARLGAFSRLLDNNFHVVGAGPRARPESRPLVVEDGAAVGPRAVLLPGAHLGRGSRVGAGAVLGKRLPDGVEVAGYPAVTVRRPA